MAVGKQTKARGFGAITVYEALRDEILSLKLSPGQLVDEASLASRFNVSRSPIREALVRLASESLLKTLPNKGTIVAPLGIERFPQYVDALDVIQRVVTRLAAEYRNEEGLEFIRTEQERFRICVENDDVLGMILGNRDFHIAVAKAANSYYLEVAYAKLLDDGRRFLRLYFKSYGDVLPRELVGGHDGMIDAIAKQDIALAERLAHEHTLEMQQRFLSYLGTRRTGDFAVTV
jgi:DNA-binding GntR family transcriptional regulator